MSSEKAIETDDNTTFDADASLIYALHIKPVDAYEQFCKKHQLTYTNVRLSTLMQNNMHQADFLNNFYQKIIKPFENQPELSGDEEYAALVSYFHNHMVNVSCYDNYSHSHNGTKITKDGGEARTASFHYCIQELLPQIQKKLQHII